MLRTALSLSCITGKGFRICNIRKARSKPGLMRQHLVAVQVCAQISAAEVAGDQLSSEELTFVPRRVVPGDYSFDIGTAGSIPLVLQTIIPALLVAGRAGSITLTGGTHVPFSPSWHYLSEVFARALSRLGVKLELTLERCGFYPKGGGKVHCRVQPAGSLAALTAEQRGKLLRVSGCSVVAHLPLSIAERQARSARAVLEAGLGNGVPIEITVRELPAFRPGTFIFLKGEYESAVSGFTALGALGKPAERVGEEAAHELVSHDKSGMALDPHLADQLVLYLARAKGRSVFTTSRLSSHLETNLLVTGRFLDVGWQLDGERDGPGRVVITPMP